MMMAKTRHRSPDHGTAVVPAGRYGDAMPGNLVINATVYVTIRLLAPLPLETSGFRLECELVTQEVLDLHVIELSSGHRYSVTRFSCQKRFERMMHEGLTLELDQTRAMRVLAELVNDGRAEIVKGRHCRLSYWTYRFQQLCDRAAVV